MRYPVHYCNDGAVIHLSPEHEDADHLHVFTDDEVADIGRRAIADYERASIRLDYGV